MNDSLQTSMSDFKFSCPACDQHLALDEGWRGRQLNCPACRNAIEIPSAPAPLTLKAAPSQVKESAPRCPECQQPVQSHSIICTNCGFNLRTRERYQSSGASRRPAHRGQSSAHEEFAAGMWLTVSLITGVVVALLIALIASPPPGTSRAGNVVGWFLIAAGAAMACVTGLKVLRNGFRQSTLWGIGMLIPGIGSGVWLKFVFRHWEHNRQLFLWNTAAWLALFIGAFVHPGASESDQAFAPGSTTEQTLRITFRSRQDLMNADANTLLTGSAYDKYQFTTLLKNEQTLQAILSYWGPSGSDNQKTIDAIRRVRGVVQVESEIGAGMTIAFEETFQKAMEQQLQGAMQEALQSSQRR